MYTALFVVLYVCIVLVSCTVQFSYFGEHFAGLAFCMCNHCHWPLTKIKQNNNNTQFLGCRAHYAYIVGRSATAVKPKVNDQVKNIFDSQQSRHDISLMWSDPVSPVFCKYMYPSMY